MKKYFYIFLIWLGTCFFNAYAVNPKINSKTGIAKQENKIKSMNIKIGKKTFEVKLENNKTVETLLKKLPMTINMSELNGNEKYFYLSDVLPSDPENVGNIKTGDIMLFGDNCLVIFYKSFKTSYRYTKIGYIEDSSQLEKVLGKTSIEVTIIK